MAKDIIDQLKDGINTIVDSTNKAFETGRTQVEIQQLKLKVGNLYKIMGKQVYSYHSEGQTNVDFEDEFIATKLKEISFYNEKIKELEDKVTAAKS